MKNKKKISIQSGIIYDISHILDIDMFGTEKQGTNQASDRCDMISKSIENFALAVA
jgi:hypothetical protein